MMNRVSNRFLNRCCFYSLSTRVIWLLELNFQADVRVEMNADDDVDDVTLNVINSLLEFIESNPPKWRQWKEKAREAGIEWA